jgi:uncharacterized membrane protein YuzA (DUF378 family)
MCVQLVLADVFVGDMEVMSRIIYSLAGIAPLYEIVGRRATKHRWCYTPV